MGCNSDYLAATNIEKELSKVACFMDEINGKPWSSSDFSGYHPEIYCRNKTKEDGDYLVRRLCEFLQNVDVSNYSLELQIWWRDHQIADQKRIQKEIDDSLNSVAKKAALEKLTEYEKKLLGFA